MSRLPRESALAASLQGEGFAWGNVEELLALVAELIDLQNRLFVQVHSKPGAPKQPPLEIPRPNRPTPIPVSPKKASADDIKTFFAGRIKTE